MAEVVLGPRAESDFERALDWYTRREAGAGFDAEFHRVLSFLADFPGAGTACDARHRYFPLRRYMYGVVYRYDGTRVVVVAVPHQRQLPGYWLGRS